jgi:DNA-binding transcriptional LysR family regulator
MEVRQLEAFAAVARERSFTRAADALGVVQPAVSQLVRRLEDELGVVLLERTSRSVRPTAAGEAFLPHAQAVLDGMAEARRAAAGLASGESGVVRVAGTPGGGEALQTLLARAREAHPGLRVELRPGEHKLQDVLSGALDVALVRGDPPVPGIAYTELERQAWRAIVSASHPLARRGRVRLAALAADPLVTIGPSRRAVGAARLFELCRRAGVTPAAGPTVPSVEDAFVVISGSRAWTLLGERNQAPGVAALELEDPLEPLRVLLAHRADPQPAVARLLACVPESPPC